LKIRLVPVQQFVYVVEGRAGLVFRRGENVNVVMLYPVYGGDKCKIFIGQVTVFSSAASNLNKQNRPAQRAAFGVCAVMQRKNKFFPWQKFVFKIFLQAHITFQLFVVNVYFLILKRSLYTLDKQQLFAAHRYFAAFHNVNIGLYSWIHPRSPLPSVSGGLQVAVVSPISRKM
jgi:hypothetical protein